MVAKMIYLVSLVGAAALDLLVGCGGLGPTVNPNAQVKTFFLAANEANFLCLKDRPLQGGPDLSAYSHLMDMKYPPTTSVEVLTAPSAKPYQVFTVLVGPKSVELRAGDSGSMAGFVTQAKAIDADAVMFCPEGSGAASGAKEVLAIKYKVEKPQIRP
jgi:hypothetical protein